MKLFVGFNLNMTDMVGHKEVLENLRRYLQHWDPIGVIPSLIREGLNPSEYDSYAGQLYTLLASGASIAQIEKYLLQCLDHMGLEMTERDREMALSIHKYFNYSTGFRK